MGRLSVKGPIESPDYASPVSDAGEKAALRTPTHTKAFQLDTHFTRHGITSLTVAEHGRSMPAGRRLEKRPTTDFVTNVRCVPSIEYVQ